MNHRLRALALLLPLAACTGARTGEEERILAPGLLGLSVRSAPEATPALPAWPSSVPARPAAEAPVDAFPGFRAAGGRGRLPGATLPGVGPVEGLVIPVSLGPFRPVRDDDALRTALFGPGADALPSRLAAASGGRFRLSFTVLPTQVDPREGALPSAPTPEVLLAYARHVLAAWATRTDLSRFDNDGPDGLPGSGDDDGALDLLVLVVESATAFPSVTLRSGVEVSTPRGILRSGPIHVLSLGRDAPPDADAALGLILGATGLEPEARFEGDAEGRRVSLLARVRLGWLPLAAGTDDLREIELGGALAFPLAGMPAGAGWWVVERGEGGVAAVRVVRRGDGSYVTSEAVVAVPPGEERLLPLDRQLGTDGPVVRLGWRRGEGTRETAFAEVVQR